jgi:hypothetical protein
MAAASAPAGAASMPMAALPATQSIAAAFLPPGTVPAPQPMPSASAPAVAASAIKPVSVKR